MNTDQSETTAALAAGLNRISRSRLGLTRYAHDSNRVRDEAAMQEALEELQRAGWTITPPSRSQIGGG
jgi:hypothetical protein